jgi:hypothetical protein
MPPFINIETKKAINKTYLLLHLYFAILWSLIIGVFIFRLDSQVINAYAPDQQWLLSLAPIFLIFFLLLSLTGFPWYFTLAFIFYIPLLLFWFIPKFLFQKGKFYLFIGYFNSVISRIRKWRSTILHTLIFIVIAMALSNVPSTPLRIIAVVVAGYVLLKYNYRYALSSFKPEGLLGIKVVKFLSPEKSSKDKPRFDTFERLMKTHEKEELSKEEIREKQMSQMVTVYLVIDAFKSNLAASKGGFAFLLYWVSTFLFSIFFTVLMIAFINYQLHLIDPSAFMVDRAVGFGEFVRYTGKCLTYGGIEEIKPMSSIAKGIEGATFFVVGIIYFMIFISFGFSYRSARINEEKEVVVKVLDNQLLEVNDYVAHKFGRGYEEIIQELEDIEESMAKIREIFKKLF